MACSADGDGLAVVLWWGISAHFGIPLVWWGQRCSPVCSSPVRGCSRPGHDVKWAIPAAYLAGLAAVADLAPLRAEVPRRLAQVPDSTGTWRQPRCRVRSPADRAGRRRPRAVSGHMTSPCSRSIGSRVRLGRADPRPDVCSLSAGLPHLGVGPAPSTTCRMRRRRSGGPWLPSSNVRPTSGSGVAGPQPHRQLPQRPRSDRSRQHHVLGVPARDDQHVRG